MPYSENAPPHLGSAFILAGTAIGAGMLALPVVSAKIGFLPMIAVFLVIAFFMTYSALLMFEANMVIGKGSSLYTMAGAVLGRPGKIVATLAPLGLFYSLMVAYLAGGGGLIHQLGTSTFDLNMSLQASVIAFALFTGVVIYCSTRIVDFVNRVLFLLMLVAFFSAVLSLSSTIEISRIAVSPPLSANYLWIAIPVVFTSFGYHGSIPSVILYQKHNTSQLPRAFMLGTLLPLVVYIIWLLVAMGSLQEASLNMIEKSGDTIGEFVNQLAFVSTTSTYLKGFLYTFSDLALLTSALGVALGLFDYLASLLQRTDSLFGRFQTLLITFCPPVIFALFYPDGFISALGYAAIALALLAVLLPTSIVWILRSKKQPLTRDTYRVPGGVGMLICSFAFGIGIIIIQLVGHMAD